MAPDCTGAGLDHPPQPACSVDQRSRDVEGERKRSVELQQFLWREITYIVGENGFRETDELVTVNAAVVLETLLDAHRDLTVKTVSTCVDGSTDDAREAGIEKELSADDDENPGLPRV